MKALPWLLLLVLLACKKEETRTDVRYEVTCRQCAVEYKDGSGVFHRDTVLWTIDYHHPVDTFPYTVVDTMPSTAAWSTVFDGESEPFISACSLRDEGYHDPVEVRAKDGASTRADADAGGCASIGD